MVFVVLYSRYRSPALALIIMGNIPLALIGSVIALNIAGQPLSVASMIGFITLAGISARNGILKVSHYINLALYEGERFGRDLVIRGSLERLTPGLMTAPSAGGARGGVRRAGGQSGAPAAGADAGALGGRRSGAPPRRSGRARSRDPAPGGG